jgi:hypothetical protein
MATLLLTVLLIIYILSMEGYSGNTKENIQTSKANTAVVELLAYPVINYDNNVIINIMIRLIREERCGTTTDLLQLVRFMQEVTYIPQEPKQSTKRHMYSSRFSFANSHYVNSPVTMFSSSPTDKPK